MARRLLRMLIMMLIIMLFLSRRDEEPEAHAELQKLMALGVVEDTGKKELRAEPMSFQEDVRDEVLRGDVLRMDHRRCSRPLERSPCAGTKSTFGDFEA